MAADRARRAAAPRGTRRTWSSRSPSPPHSSTWTPIRVRPAPTSRRRLRLAGFGTGLGSLDRAAEPPDQFLKIDARFVQARSRSATCPRHGLRHRGARSPARPFDGPRGDRGRRDPEVIGDAASTRAGLRPRRPSIDARGPPPGTRRERCGGPLARALTAVSSATRRSHAGAASCGPRRDGAAGGRASSSLAESSRFRRSARRRQRSRPGERPGGPRQPSATRTRPESSASARLQRQHSSGSARREE